MRAALKTQNQRSFKMSEKNVAYFCCFCGSEFAENEESQVFHNHSFLSELEDDFYNDGYTEGKPAICKECLKTFLQQ